MKVRISLLMGAELLALTSIYAHAWNSNEYFDVYSYDPDLDPDLQFQEETLFVIQPGSESALGTEASAHSESEGEITHKVTYSE